MICWTQAHTAWGSRSNTSRDEIVRVRWPDGPFGQYFGREVLAVSGHYELGVHLDGSGQHVAMRRYPIGSFLISKVTHETASSYAFYDFLTDYHARDHPYASKAVVPAGQGVLAILDGQQRLTALNIAVYGSLAVKKKYAW